MTPDPSLELVRTISEVLDIRRVFPRVSEIAKDVVPHDCLELVFQDHSDYLTEEARSVETFPAFRRLALAGENEFRVVGDLRNTRLAFECCDPPDYVDRIVDAGYRSLLNVRSVAGSQVMGLVFFSKQPDAYSTADLPAARQIADYVALAVSHEQLADQELRRAEARGRAQRLDMRIQSVADAREGGRPAIGQSPEWKDVLRKATQVAATETTVLLQGESGTGKEVVARFIHRASPRKSGPFVAINCAALPDHLLESELFGYERGAFTGAQQPKPGQIELASGGVLFLDEVTEMSAAAQAKLLRVLQEREFQRLGGTRLLRANVRVITATNRNLREAVACGAFREDLFYRLQVFDIQMPPLRERTRDIPLLVQAFLEEIGQAIGRRPSGLTPEASAMLMKYAWPGNVRELRNVLERAAILCDGGPITPSHLSLHAESIAPSSMPATDLRAAERRAIEKALRDTDGNKAKTARRLGLTRTQLYVRLRKYDIEQAAVA
jgi:transcriptional regulator with GAF, ATPase, and Fis domain